MGSCDGASEAAVFSVGNKTITKDKNGAEEKEKKGETRGKRCSEERKGGGRKRRRRKSNMCATLYWDIWDSQP